MATYPLDPHTRKRLEMRYNLPRADAGEYESEREYESKIEYESKREDESEGDVESKREDDSEREDESKSGFQSTPTAVSSDPDNTSIDPTLQQNYQNYLLRESVAFKEFRSVVGCNKHRYANSNRDLAITLGFKLYIRGEKSKRYKNLHELGISDDDNPYKIKVKPCTDIDWSGYFERIDESGALFLPLPRSGLRAPPPSSVDSEEGMIFIRRIRRQQAHQRDKLKRVIKDITGKNIKKEEKANIAQLRQCKKEHPKFPVDENVLTSGTESDNSGEVPNYLLRPPPPETEWFKGFKSGPKVPEPCIIEPPKIKQFFDPENRTYSLPKIPNVNTCFGGYYHSSEPPKMEQVNNPEHLTLPLHKIRNVNTCFGGHYHFRSNLRDRSPSAQKPPIGQSDWSEAYRALKEVKERVQREETERTKPGFQDLALKSLSFYTKTYGKDVGLEKFRIWLEFEAEFYQVNYTVYMALEDQARKSRWLRSCPFGI